MPQWPDARDRPSAGILDSEALLATARTLTESLDVTEIARRGAREMTLLLGTDTSIAFNARDRRGVSRPVAGYHVPPEIRNAAYELPMSDPPGFVVEAVAAGLPVASADVAGDPRFDHPAIRTMGLTPTWLRPTG